MKPVLTAFSGHIPADMKELLPGADIRPVSLWDGFGEECRTYMLHPDDPIFARIQKLFLEEQTALFGTKKEILCFGTFHFNGTGTLTKPQGLMKLPCWNYSNLFLKKAVT